MFSVMHCTHLSSIYTALPTMSPIVTVSTTHVPATSEELKLTPLPTNNDISETNDSGMCDFMIVFSFLTA